MVTFVCWNRAGGKKTVTHVAINASVLLLLIAARIDERHVPRSAQSITSTFCCGAWMGGLQRELMRT